MAEPRPSRSSWKEESIGEVGKRPLPPVRDLGIRRPTSGRLLFHRIHQNVLFLKLRSLLPPSKVLPNPDELRRGVDESTGERRGPWPVHVRDKENNGPCNEKDNDDASFLNNCEEEEEETRHEDFVPTIKMRKMDGALLISPVIQKEVALSSNLFRLLEKEKLSIVFEQQYRTKTKVCHTIQVRVTPEMDVDAFKAKLESWGAGKEPC